MAPNAVSLKKPCQAGGKEPEDQRPQGGIPHPSLKMHLRRLEMRSAPQGHQGRLVGPEPPPYGFDPPVIIPGPPVLTSRRRRGAPGKAPPDGAHGQGESGLAVP